MTTARDERAAPPVPPAPWAAFRDAWVVYEDHALLVVDKPESVPTQRGEAQQYDDLASRLTAYLTLRADQRDARFQQPYLSLHQHLERDVSGLVVLSRDKRANPDLVRQFEDREVELGCLALVRGDARQLPRRLEVPGSRGRSRLTLEV
jgi:23S rRNA-/tRNA-specific pseudouridylate synthase